MPALSRCPRWGGVPPVVKSMTCGALIFLHIPKTGGTSVNTLFYNVANQSDWTMTELWQDLGPGLCEQRVAWNATEAFAKLNTELGKARPKVIVSIHHGVPGLQKYMLNHWIMPTYCSLKSKGCELRLATVLRDPDSRATSGLFFNRVKEDRTSIRSFIEWNSNLQVDYILRGSKHCKSESEARAVMTSEGQVEKAMQTLAFFDLVGRTEELDVFNAAVLETLGHPSINVSMNSFGGQKITDAGFKYKLLENESSFIAQSNKLDDQLYSGFCQLPERRKNIINCR